MTFDPSGDFTVFDCTEAVTYRSVATGSVSDAGAVVATWTEVAVAKALRRLVSIRAREASKGKLKTGDAVWAIAAEELGSVVPKEGDQVLDGSGTTWRVIAVDRKPAVSMWRVFARK